MTLKFSQTSATPETADVDCAIVGVFEGRNLTPAAARIDEAGGGALRRLIDSGDVTGKVGNHALLYAVPGVKAARVLVVGLGDPRSSTAPASAARCAIRSAHCATRRRFRRRPG